MLQESLKISTEKIGHQVKSSEMNSLEQRIFINPITKDRELSISSESFYEDLKFIQDEGIKIVSVGKTNFDWNKFYLLVYLTSIDGINFGEGTRDITDLSFLDIKKLSINGTKGLLTLSGLVNLEELFLVYENGLIGLNSLQSLKVFTFNNCRDKTFNWHENFNGLVSLEKLELTDCFLPPDLSLLNSCKQLKELEIYFNPKPFRLQALQYNSKLEKLILSQCPHLQHKEDIPLLQSVKWLRLTDCGPIDDCSLFDSMSNLEVLIVTGKSYFVNGDLSGMMGRLKHFGFENKRHYSHKPEDFPSIFRKE